jgi:membrane-associated protein
VAGVGAMTYPKFIVYNVIGGMAWVALFLFGGYFFGNLPFVQNNFSFVLLAIIIISVSPAVIEIIRNRQEGRKQVPPPANVP